MADTAVDRTDYSPSLMRTALVVLLPFGVGYYLSYLYRTVNVVITKPLAADLSLSAADLGMLTSVYFIVFAAFQTPLGVLLDRYGPRRVQVGLLVFAVAGSALFATGDSLPVLALGRALIGLGVSGCLMAAIKANAMWFPLQRLPLVNGCTLAFGSFGALSATVPVERLFEALGWRPIFIILAAVTVAAIALIYFIVPERQPAPAAGASGGGVAGQFRDLRLIYTSGFFWRIGLVTFLHNSAFLSYQSLWMGPWLRDVAGMALPSIAQTMLWFNVGMFAGALVIGAVADRLQTFGVRPVAVMGTGIALSIVVQTMFVLEQTGLAVPLCFAFGFFGSSSLLAYSIMGQDFPAWLVGRVNTALNMLTFIGAFAAQWGVGLIINRWPEAAGGQYDPAGHRAALVALIGLEIAAFAWFIVARRRRAAIPQ